VILLQQSVVQSTHQLVRLQAIDHGWARWAAELTTAASNFNMQIVAPVDKVNESDFSIINAFDISAHKESVVYTPYDRLLRSLLWILCSTAGETGTKWIVMANDHTFLIPLNLQRFLLKLNSDELIYTGNMLGINYAKIKLKFASGGAGAVMSHATVKVIAILWLLLLKDTTLLSPTSYMNFSGQSMSDFCKEYIACNLNVNGTAADINLTSNGPHFSKAVELLKQWLDDQPMHTLGSMCGVSSVSEVGLSILFYNFLHSYYFTMSTRR
jgi:hypothetical protein